MDRSMPAGRPSDYDPAYCERVIELGREGKSGFGEPFWGHDTFLR